MTAVSPDDFRPFLSDGAVSDRFMIDRVLGACLPGRYFPFFL